MDTVSVVIPTYNAGGVLERTIASVRAQEGVSYVEIIVADDASTDGTLELARGLGAVVIEAPGNSGGPNRGRNAGLAAATGDWICHMDQDDEFAPGKVRAQLAMARETGARVLWTGFEVRDRSHGTSELRGVEPEGVVGFARDEAFRRWMRRDYSLALYPSTLMLHRSLNDVRFEEHFGVSDFDYVLRLLRHQRAARLGEALMVRHVDGSNLSLDARYRRIDYYYALMVLEEYEAEYPREVAEARARLNGTRARYLYLVGDMPGARRHFLHAKWDWKTAMFLATSFAGSGLVRRRFRFFG